MPNSTPVEVTNTHIIGGFSIDTPIKLSRAAADGVQVVFYYGQPPAESSILGKNLKALHMQVVDGFISSYLYYYECHRTKTIKPPPPGYAPYCLNDTHPELASESVLLATIAAHLQQVKNNPLIIGYWVLDDWNAWDAGSARQILIDVHKLIQQYTPERPAICGFGGTLAPNEGYGWEDWIADNFSTQGCDRVGLYIYASSLSVTTPIASSDAYDWSMSDVLSAMFVSLENRGWTITREPLIGIGQAFGGPIAHTNRYLVTPTANDLETQSRSFCEHGASGLVFYAWNDSGFGPTSQTPMDSAGIETGIQRGIAACKQIWSRHL